jgi:hypothetical protein
VKGALAMLAVTLAFGGACEAEAELATGRLAYADESGDLVVVDLESGARRAFTPPRGSPADIAVSLDRRSVAFNAGVDFDRRDMLVASLEDDELREIGPEQGSYPRWGVGEHFGYRVTSGDAFRDVLVEAGATMAREIGDFDASSVVFSPVAPLLAADRAASRR